MKFVRLSDNGVLCLLLALCTYVIDELKHALRSKSIHGRIRSTLFSVLMALIFTHPWLHFRKLLVWRSGHVGR